jgi:hypothetical protein
MRCLEDLAPALKDRAKFTPPLRVEEFLDICCRTPLESTIGVQIGYCEEVWFMLIASAPPFCDH